MTRNEIKDELHKAIEQLDTPQLQELKRIASGMRPQSVPTDTTEYPILRTGGFAEGKIHLAEDWDSPEVKDEIAREFGMLD